MDVNEPPGPGMPRIQKLANLGPVGVLSSCCTILQGRMALSMERHLTKSSENAYNPDKDVSSPFRRLHAKVVLELAQQSVSVLVGNRGTRGAVKKSAEYAL